MALQHADAAAREKNKARNAAHFEFQDVLPSEVLVHRSLYLDTLGAAEACRRSPSPAQGCECEGYAHGSLSTSGIQGASPAAHSLAKHQQLRLQQDPAAADTSTSTNSSSSSRPNVLGQQHGCSVADDDPGMRPRVWVAASTNRPDLTHSTADIDGAQPWPKDVCRHPRDTNPLSPQYQLASGSGMPFPLGPATPDRQLLRDPLNVSDIPGAAQRPKTPAARAAAARAAAAAAAGRAAADGADGSSTAGADGSSTAGAAGAAGAATDSSSSRRPGVLEVADIDGAFASWRPTHRRHVGASAASSPARDACLDVSDINSFMARFKPAPRNSAAGQYKGHPGGPRVPSPIRPRSQPSIMDNSLRKFDIAGTSVRLAPRATHTTCLDVADIEGTHAAVRDRATVFAAVKIASAAAAAQQHDAQAMLSGLQLNQQELLQLWQECSKRDKDRSGFLTGQELAQAMQRAHVQLGACDSQRLVAALSNSVGLLNYKQLTRQLKGRLSRPASALAVLPCAPRAPSSSAAAAVRPPFATTADEHVAGQQRQRQRPHSAVPGGSLRLQQRGRDASTQVEQAAAGEAISSSAHSSSSRSSGCSRPSAAPARPSSAPPARGLGNSSSQEPHACARRWSRSNREGVSCVSHWFAGSRRDAVAAAETAHWRPGAAAAALAVGWGLNSPAPWGGVHADDDGGGCSGVEHGAAAAAGQPQAAGDVLPAWMVGAADALHGTCRISPPFGDAAQAAETGGVQAVWLERLQPAAAAAAGFVAGSSARHSQRQRPQSAGPASGRMGLAERRRLAQSEQQDLQAVRMLG